MNAESDTVAALQARLEHLEVESTRSAKVQAALYRVAEAASSSTDMSQFYAALHAAVGELMYAGNFFISVLDEQSGMLAWPYHVDEKDLEAEVWESEPLAEDKGATGYVIRTGRSLHGATDYDRLIDSGELQVVGTRSLDAIFVPLRQGSSGLGALAVQSYTAGIGYTEEDVHVLEFVAAHIATALTRARAIEETRQRNAELAIINSVGEAMARTLDIKTMTRLVGDKVLEIFGCDIASILLLDARTNLIHTAYTYDKGEGGYVDYYEPFPLGMGLTSKVMTSRRGLRLGTSAEQTAAGGYIPPESIEQSSGVMANSWLGVPIIVGTNVLGIVNICNYAANSFNEAHERLLQTLSTNMGVAIENARRFEAEQQRVAELQIINSIQQGLASKLDLQGVIDLVGDKLREVLKTDEIGVRLYDEATDLMEFPYEFEHGQRLKIEPRPPSAVFRAVHRERKSVFGATAEIAKRFQVTTLAGTDQSKSLVNVPILSGAGVIGAIVVEDYEREDAFNESNIRLLETIAASMGVALENARLFDETQRLLKETEQRNAELAIITSVQEGLASKLDFSSIIDLVGDKVGETFKSDTTYVFLYDRAAQLIQRAYYVERGHRHQLGPTALGQGLTSIVINTRQPLLLGTSKEADAQQAPDSDIESPDQEKDLNETYLGVPIIAQGEVVGVVSVQSYRQNAYTQGDVGLLQTLANAMSVALENARLFDETQRLLKETDQRAAELAIINSTQEALAAKLDIQGIYDAVGERISEIFHGADVGIRIYDAVTNMVSFPYARERGEPLHIKPLPLTTGVTAHVFQTRSPLLINSNLVEETAKLGSQTLPGTETEKSGLWVPIIVGGEARGLLELLNLDREDAFSDGDVRLLTTIANALSVALENARLFAETQRLLKETEQRAAELAIINSVQEGLASKMEMQSIYDLVGEKIRETFRADTAYIAVLDETHKTFDFPYYMDSGQRLSSPGLPIGRGLTSEVFGSRVPLMLNSKVEMAQHDSVTDAYEDASKDLNESFLGVPVLLGDRVSGVVSVQSHKAHAYAENDMRLLQTLANSMSVALENARLFDETQRLLKETDQRAAELQIINSVQEGLASKLDIQAIYELVGEKVREIFKVHTVGILSHDAETGMMTDRYSWEKGDRTLVSGPIAVFGFRKHVIETRRSMLINRGVVEASEQYGNPILYGAAAKSCIFVPMLLGDRVTAVITLQDMEREDAFSEGDVRLLETLASSMSVALENARLFDETQRLLKVSEQRAAELASINTVSQALVAEADLDRMIQLVGDELLEIFNPDIAYVALLDRESNMLDFPYQHGDEMPRMAAGQGLTGKIMETGAPLLINRDIDKRRQELGTQLVGKQASSYLGVPILAGGEVIGAISVQSTRGENAFSEDDSRLLSTIAANTGAAIQTARLHTETRRRAQEMATLAEIGNDIAGTRELEPVLERIAQHALSIMHVRDIAITLRDEDGGDFHARVALGRYSDEMKKLVVRPGHGIIGTILVSGNAEFVNDPQNDARRITVPGTPEVEEDPECFMGAPLLSRGEVIGGLMVWRLRKDGMFTQAELDFLVSVARQTTIAIESARLYLETQRRANEMSALAEVGREISASLDKSAVLELISGHAMDLLAAENSAVFLMEPDGRSMRAIAARGDAAEALRAELILLGEGIIGTMAGEAKAEFVNDVFHDPRGIVVPGMNESETERLMAAPLMRGDEVVGMLAVWRTTAPFSQADLNFLIGLSRQAAIAFENARLFDEIKRQGAYLETIFLNSPVAIVTVDERDSVMSWSPAAEKLFGYTSAEAVGQNVDTLVANSEAVRQEAVNYTEQGKHNQYVHRVTRRTRKDGTLVDVDLSALPLPLEGGKTGVVAIYNDVGEIQRQRKYYEAIVQNSPVAIVTVDQKSRVVSWNPGAEQMFGYDKDEAIGRNVDELVAGTAETLSEARNYNQQARREELHVITKRTRKDRSLVDVELSGVPLPLPTGESGLVAIYHDITELQRARQEAVAANEAKSAFLATMSHEIRTPMNAVIGMSGLLMDTPLNPEQHDYAETIRNSGDALLTIINDILDFSKIEAGKMELESQPFDLRECVETAMDLVATRANEKRLDLAYIIEDEVPVGVRGDVTRLRQILLNLASNAVKFTEKGEVVLTVAAGKEPDQLLVHRSRQRHRHTQESHGPAVRFVQPGGFVHHQEIRRHGPGPGDQQAAGRNDGRNDVGGVRRRRQGLDVCLHHPGAGRQGGAAQDRPGVERRSAVAER